MIPILNKSKIKNQYFVQTRFYDLRVLKKILRFTTRRAQFFTHLYSTFFIGKFNKRIKGFTKTTLVVKKIAKTKKKIIATLPISTINKCGIGFIFMKHGINLDFDINKIEQQLTTIEHIYTCNTLFSLFQISTNTQYNIFNYHRSHSRLLVPNLLIV